MAETIASKREHLIEGCTATRAGHAALELAAENGALESPEALRQEFCNQMIEIADAYDSMDHRIAAPGSELQNDCQAVRELVRSFV